MLSSFFCVAHILSTSYHHICCMGIVQTVASFCKYFFNNGVFCTYSAALAAWAIVDSLGCHCAGTGRALSHVSEGQISVPTNQGRKIGVILAKPICSLCL